MFKKVISLLISPFILLGGTPDFDPGVPGQEPHSEEIILYQTDELSVTATDFTYAASVTFSYTIINKTDQLLKFNLPYTTIDGSNQSEPLQCMLKAGATSKSLTYTQPETTHQQRLKFSVNDYDEYDLAFAKIGKILIIDLQPSDDAADSADLVYDGKARIFKAGDGFYIDNVPLVTAVTMNTQTPSDLPEGAFLV